MFVLAQTATYWWPITVRQPSPTEPGAFVDATFEACFLYLSKAQNAALIDEARTRTLSDDVVLTRVVAGFRGVADASGVDVPFSADNFAALLDRPGVTVALIAGYFDSRAEAAAKN